MMKRVLGGLIYFSAAFMLALVFAGCENLASPDTADAGAGSDTEAGPKNKPPAPVAVTGAGLDYPALTVAAGDSVTLTAAVSPGNAANTAVSWESSDPAKATVAGDGLGATVTGVAAGDAVITVTTADGGFTASCAVTVTPTVDAITLTAQPDKTVYYIGDTLELAGLAVTADYSDSTSGLVTITPGHISGFDPDTAGEQPLTITYGGKTAGFTVTVRYKVTVTVSPFTAEVFKGRAETVQLSAEVRAEKGDLPPERATVTWSVTGTSADSGTGIDENGLLTVAAAEGSPELTVKATAAYTDDGEKSGTATVSVSPVLTTGIAVTAPPTKTFYYIGDTLNPAGLAVAADYSDGASGPVTITLGHISGFDSAQAGDKTVTVTYNGKTADFTVTVRHRVNVSVSAAPAKLLKGRSVKFSAVVAAETGTPPQDVDWRIDGTPSAGTSIDANGTLTVALYEAAASLSVRAVSRYDTAQSGAVTVNLATPFITSREEWRGASLAISYEAGGTAYSPKTYTLTIQSDVEVEGLLAFVDTNTNIAGDYKEVHLVGSGTLTLLDAGSILRTLANQTIIIDGPTLRGRDTNSMALVHIIGGTVELRSGAISGNSNIDTASRPDGGQYAHGGGVYVNSGGTFILSGGTVSGNHAVDSNAAGAGIDGVHAYGGGVYVNSGGTFTMSGGAVSGNSVIDNDVLSFMVTSVDAYGGGVYVHSGGTFTLSDGTISGNSSNNERRGTYSGRAPNSSGGSSAVTRTGYWANGSGGGVYSGGNFTMSGGIISSNDGGSMGGGMYLSGSGTFTLNKGTISGNTVIGGTYTQGNNGPYTSSTPYGSGVCAETGTAFIMYDGDISENTGSDYGGVYTEGTFTLKGGTISGNDGHGIFTTGLFTMHNGTVSGNGNFGIGIGTTGTFTMHNGTVSGNGTGTVFGGGVYILGTFTMDGGTICDNKNSYRSTEARYTMRNGGAGVRVYGNGTFTMNDGTISGNRALYTTGGGVSVSAPTSSNNPKFIMNGGTISGNSGILGGGVYVYYGTFEMVGGTVTDNTAAEGRGGGVYVYSTGTFTKTGGTIHGDTPASNAHTPGDKTTNTALYFNDKNYKAEQNGHAVFVDRGTTTHIYYWRNATLWPYTSITTTDLTTARPGIFEGYRIAP